MEARTTAFDFPEPKPLAPPLITLEGARAGYAPGTDVLAGLNLRLDMDDRIALLGAIVVFASLLLPMLFGDAGLAHRHGEIGAGPFSWKWHTVFVFEIGVVMIVGGGLTAAALSLWETPTREED